MTTSAVPNHAGYSFSAEIVDHAVWLHFRFPLINRAAGTRSLAGLAGMSIDCNQLGIKCAADYAVGAISVKRRRRAFILSNPAASRVGW